MKIETIYDLGQTVAYIANGNIQTTEIESLVVTQPGVVVYVTADGEFLAENLYASKTLAATSWLKDQGISLDANVEHVRVSASLTEE